MVYDIEKVSLLVDSKAVTGFADGSSIKADRNNDDVTPQTGLQGDYVYSENADRSGTITFNLFSVSASLPWLRNIADQRRPVPVTLRNANRDGGVIVTGQDCMILKTPGFEGGSTSASIEVRIHVPRMIFH